MKYWDIKKGNTSVQDIEILDRDGNAVTNLASASEIKFEIKTTKTGTAIFTKTVNDGIEVDTPSEGYLRITLTPTDTNQNEGKYFMALQVKWSSVENYEVIIKMQGDTVKKMRIEQDVIQ